MAEGGISLLSLTANAAEDPQTLRMVAGAIANLCGNGMKIEFISWQFLSLSCIMKLFTTTSDLYFL